VSIGRGQKEVSIRHGREEVNVERGAETTVCSGDEREKWAQEEEVVIRPGRRY